MENIGAWIKENWDQICDVIEKIFALISEKLA